MPTTSLTPGAPVPGREAAEPETIDPASGSVRLVMTAHISGTRDGRDWPLPGEEIEIPAAEAADLVRHFLARPAPAPEEAAIVSDGPPERATEPRGRRRP